VYIFLGFELLFNDIQSVNQGSVDEQRCLKYCYDDFKCVGVKIKNGYCYTTTNFEPFTADACLPTDKCYSVTGKKKKI
jgi:hypothetical protein